MASGPLQLGERSTAGCLALPTARQNQENPLPKITLAVITKNLKKKKIAGLAHLWKARSGMFLQQCGTVENADEVVGTSGILLTVIPR
jgi:hypothetical protein